MKIKLSDYVMQVIKEHTDTVFFLPGGGCMHLVDSLRKSGLTPVECLHEQSAAIAADGYSQASNYKKIGVALVTSGPGATNAITGVAASYMDSTPVLIISGQTKVTDLKDTNQRQNGVQEVDIVSIVTHITKFAITVINPNTIKDILETAIQVATTARFGPVWIDIPLDIQGAIIDTDKQIIECYRMNPTPSFRDKDYENILQLLKKSKKPILVVGQGARMDFENVNNIIEKLKIPVLTTWRSLDLIEEDNMYYCGRFGIVGQRAANHIIQQSDFAIFLGARLDYPSAGFDRGNFAKKAVRVIVEVDDNEISKFLNDIPMHKDTYFFEIDVHYFNNKFLEKLKNNFNIKDYKWGKWLSKCKKLYAKHPVPAKKTQDGSWAKNCVNPYDFFDILSSLIDNKAIVVPASSGVASAEMFLQSFKVKQQRIFSCPGLGSMGFGLPHAIGAYYATKSSNIVCIEGDGGLQHNIQELELLKRYCLPIKLFVLNNGGYNSIKKMQKRIFGELIGADESSGLTLPSLKDIASAYKINYFIINSNDKMIITTILQYVFENVNYPFIVEVMIDPDVEVEPRLSSKVNKNGTMVSDGFDQLYPYMDIKL